MYKDRESVCECCTPQQLFVSTGDWEKLSGDRIYERNQRVSVGGSISLSVVHRLYYPKSLLFDFEKVLSAGHFCAHLYS